MDVDEFIKRLKRMEGVEFKRDETMLMNRIVDFSIIGGRLSTSGLDPKVLH